MTADDCVKVIAGVAAAQAVTLAALTKVYLTVRKNSAHIEAVRGAVIGGSDARPGA